MSPLMLDGRRLRDFMQFHHAGQVAQLSQPPRLAIIRQGSIPATKLYLTVKKRYGDSIGVAVDTYTEDTLEAVLGRIVACNYDPTITGILVQLPFSRCRQGERAALDTVALAKDVDGLATGSPFEAATPKGVGLLLRAYDLDLTGCRVVVIGLGPAVGLPIFQWLSSQGYNVQAIDLHTPPAQRKNLLTQAHVIIAATGDPGSLKSAEVPPGAILIDAGAPDSDLEPGLAARPDLRAVTPNPGGMGPATVVGLFDNLLMAALGKTTNAYEALVAGQFHPAATPV